MLSRITLLVTNISYHLSKALSSLEGAIFFFFQDDLDLEDYEEEDMARLAHEKVAFAPLFVEMVPRRCPSWGLVGKEPEMIENE